MREETTLDELRPGALFVTRNGVYAVKSEYRYGSEAGSQWECILLESGEYAHFADGNKTIVREVSVIEPGYYAYDKPVSTVSPPWLVQAMEKAQQQAIEHMKYRMDMAMRFQDEVMQAYAIAPISLNPLTEEQIEQLKKNIVRPPVDCQILTEKDIEQINTELARHLQDMRSMRELAQIKDIGETDEHK